MLALIYAPRFVRHFKRLPKELQEEVIAKIELFKELQNHKLLKVHKLHGKLKKFYGFSVDFHNRIVLDYVSKNEVVLLTVGDHDIYK